MTASAALSSAQRAAAEAGRIVDAGGDPRIVEAARRAELAALELCTLLHHAVGAERQPERDTDPCPPPTLCWCHECTTGSASW